MLQCGGYKGKKPLRNIAEKKLAAGMLTSFTISEACKIKMVITLRKDCLLSRGTKETLLHFLPFIFKLAGNGEELRHSNF